MNAPTVNRTPLLDLLCTELVERDGAHTILLYGSRANGSEGPDSDYDIAAFAPRADEVRDTRVIGGEFLDVFLYPDSMLTQPSPDHLKLRQCVVLLQRGQQADDFLAGLHALFHQGPEPLPRDEIDARKAWAWKMAQRIDRDDIEGNYRRVWLLTSLLEDYFALRGRWFEGPKKSLQWLQVNDTPTHEAFAAALRPGASTAVIRQAVARTVDGVAPGA